MTDHSLYEFDRLPDAAYVRVRTVASLYSTDVSTIWRWVKRGKIPQPEKLSEGITACNVGQLRRALAPKSADTAA